MFNLQNNIDAHVIPEEEFLQKVKPPVHPNIPSFQQHPQQDHVQRVRRSAKNAHTAYVPSMFFKVSISIL